MNVFVSSPGREFDYWCSLANHHPRGTLLGRTQMEWRELTRRELHLATDRPIIATGHQTLLWHPGILAKYLAMDAAAHACGFATANLVVDQHVGEFGEFEAPVRKDDGSLDVLRIRLTDSRPDVPMALHPAFMPNDPPPGARYALDSVGEGVQRIVGAIRAHSDAPNAAVQMAQALADLMRRWVRPSPNVCAAALCETSLAKAMIEQMVKEPERCAEAYNRAVAAVPCAGIPPLVIRGDEEVEMPLWRTGKGGERVRAYVSGLASEGIRTGGTPVPPTQSTGGTPVPPTSGVMPRALLMTALVRLGMCDLFVHGTGGAAYDRAMELWIRDWLGVEVAPIAVVTADLCLPLLDEDENLNLDAAHHAARHIWHDPLRSDETAVSDAKRHMLSEIAHMPRNTPQRKAAYFRMHETLERLREQQGEKVAAAVRVAERARRLAADLEVAHRRDWAFPLYPQSSIDSLAEAIRAAEAAPTVKAGM